ncbi:MAG TPA: DUF4231 domain-containing protein [Pyrinomonadaceae bacterium]|nr:DUF4231 domain-containing protein [Pyrinomonadaceae bacterium]
MSEPDVVIDRLEDQIKWYGQESAHAKRMFKRLKTATLAISVSIPLSAAFATLYPLYTGVITGAMGASIALLEGLQQLNQYHQNWITYRSTTEALKHEKFLFLSTAGPYAATSNPKSLLAERIESLVSQEHAKWTSSQEQTPKTQKASGTY